MRPDHFTPDPAAKVEPSAAARKFGAHLYDYYAAMIQAGFSEAQALQIIGHVIASAAPKNQ
ncbi:hypothetical protein [Nocardia farcinica]|uniref:hypothetical protein n=1 Tax=Nocardia farcinica TaxID=37329 RepID=UPI002458315B|nr:hypothetical protein [Nocardia farcinica]